MAKLIPMDEAAQMLGLTVEDLNDMRSRSEVFGYRDGSSWKFKEDEIKRVASQLAADKPTDAVADGVETGFDDDLDKLVGRINNVIYNNTDPEKYITFFYGQPDLKTRKIKYVNAGHNPPMLVRAG